MIDIPTIIPLVGVILTVVFAATALSEYNVKCSLLDNEVESFFSTLDIMLVPGLVLNKRCELITQLIWTRGNKANEAVTKQDEKLYRKALCLIKKDVIKKYPTESAELASLLALIK